MKNLLLLLSFCFLVLVSDSFGQYNLDWTQPSESTAKTGVMSTVDSDDNLIVVGHTGISPQLFIRKFTLSGDLLWEANDTSTVHSLYEKAHWVNCDANNNILVIGSIGSYSSSSGGAASIVVLKYSQTGTLLWRTVIPLSPIGSHVQFFDCRSVVDSNGFLYIGTTRIGTSNLSGIILTKIGLDGTVLFSNISTANSPAYSVSMRIKNNKIVIGSESGPVNSAPVVMWDTDGNLLWSANAVGRGTADVEIDEDENTYVLTSIMNEITPITFMSNMKISKFSPAGNLLWSKVFTNATAQDFPTRMTYVNGRISFIGYGNGINWRIFQTDKDGILLWSTTYDGTTQNDEYPYYIVAKPNGEVIVTGKGGPSPNPLTSDIQMPVVQFSNTGVQNWISTPNVYGGWGMSLGFASDSSLYAISSTSMTAYHYSRSVTENKAITSIKPVKIYPNPFSSHITLEAGNDEVESVTLSDVLGRNVKSISIDNQNVTGNQFTIDLSDLKSGIYFCSVQSKGKVEVLNIVKE